jgi:hypothetical protein
MRWQLDTITETTRGHGSAVEVVLIPKAHDIGDFEVRRALPDATRRAVGPFVFFDQMGPATFTEGQAMDVRPHPHIGLATITWLFEGEIRHRDSLGYDVVIRPGAVNWMTAGRGIVHSERSPDSQRHAGARLAGIQVWVALPRASEEMAPCFHHYDAHEIPRLAEQGIRIVLIAGSAWGQVSPVVTESPILYAELNLAQHRELQLPGAVEERALYVYSGKVETGGNVYGAGTMIVFRPDAPAVIRAAEDCCCMLLGGARLDGPRHLYWNFVSSSEARIEQAKDDWLNGRFAMVDGDPEFIPLPGSL